LIQRQGCKRAARSDCEGVPRPRAGWVRVSGVTVSMKGRVPLAGDPLTSWEDVTWWLEASLVPLEAGAAAAGLAAGRTAAAAGGGRLEDANNIYTDHAIYIPIIF